METSIHWRLLMNALEQELVDIRLMLENVPKRRQEALKRCEAELVKIDEQEQEYHRRIAEIRYSQISFGKRW